MMTKRISLFLVAIVLSVAVYAQGVMVKGGKETTICKDVHALRFASHSLEMDGVQLPADEVYPFPSTSLLPGDAISLNFGCKADTCVVGFVSPNVWVASGVPTGFILSQTYGDAGYQEISISTADNPGSEVYEGTLTIMGGDGSICTIELKQVGEQEPVVVLQDPRIGDFFYADGTWSTELVEGKTVIGVVFRVGCATEHGDNVGYYRKKDGTTRFDDVRGYVVALQDASDGCWWSNFNDDKGCGCSTATDDFRGYTNTHSIMTTAQAQGGLTESTNSYPACYYAAVAYEQECPAPAETSGWYLPAAFQMAYIWNRVWFDEDGSGRACLENSFKRLGEAATPLYRNDAEYWTSTEQVNSYGNSNYAYYFDFSANNFYNGTISHYRKNTSMRVRSVLTF